MKLIICCGGDRVGKSTLCNEFVKNGFEYHHFIAPKFSAYGEFGGFANQYLLDPVNRDKKIILDRYMYCDFPYSKHYGRSTDMTWEGMHRIEDIMLGLDPAATIVYCENDIDLNWKLIEEEGKHEFKTKEEVVQLRNDYRDVMLHSKLRCMTYDFTKGDTPVDFVKKVI